MSQYYQNPDAQHAQHDPNTFGPQDTTGADRHARTGPTRQQGGVMQTAKNVLTAHAPHHDDIAAQHNIHDARGEFAQDTNASSTLHQGRGPNRVPAEAPHYDTAGESYGHGAAGGGTGTSMPQQPGAGKPNSGPVGHGQANSGGGYGTGAQPYPKPKLGDKVKGTAEVGVGRLTNNAEMQGKGAEHKAGFHQPQDATHTETDALA